MTFIYLQNSLVSSNMEVNNLMFAKLHIFLIFDMYLNSLQRLLSSESSVLITVNIVSQHIYSLNEDLQLDMTAYCLHLEALRQALHDMKTRNYHEFSKSQQQTFTISETLM
jgi:hypothetical protein